MKKIIEVFLLIVTIIIVLLFVYFCINFYFCKQKLDPFKSTIIYPCLFCDNIIVINSDSDKNQYYKASVDCENINHNHYYVIKTNDKDYEVYKIKLLYLSYVKRSTNEQFKSFYEWYQKNKDKKFYKLAKAYERNETWFEIKEDTDDGLRNCGRALVPYTYSSFRKVESHTYTIIDYQFKYSEDQNELIEIDGWKKVDCDLVEYYIHCVQK